MTQSKLFQRLNNSNSQNNIMEFEKDFIFKILILKNYGMDFKKYKENHMIRKQYLQKCNSIDDYENIIWHIEKDNLDKDRFYYIYWEHANILYDLKQYGEASEYYKKAIDNVITDSYHENKFKFKSNHYKFFLKEYPKAIDSLIKSREFDDVDYYDELNLYSKTGLELSWERKGDFYAELGAKNVALKYYEKHLQSLKNIYIRREYDYDPYVNGFLEDEYKEKVKKKNEKIQAFKDKANSLYPNEF